MEPRNRPEPDDVEATRSADTDEFLQRFGLRLQARRPSHVALMATAGSQRDSRRDAGDDEEEEVEEVEEEVDEWSSHDGHRASNRDADKEAASPQRQQAAPKPSVEGEREDESPNTIITISTTTTISSRSSSSRDWSSRTRALSDTPSLAELRSALKLDAQTAVDDLTRLAAMRTDALMSGGGHTPPARRRSKFSGFGRIFKPWKWRKKKKSEKFQQTSAVLEKKISSRASREELIRKGVLKELAETDDQTPSPSETSEEEDHGTPGAANQEAEAQEGAETPEHDQSDSTSADQDKSKETKDASGSQSDEQAQPASPAQPRRSAGQAPEAAADAAHPTKEAGSGCPAKQPPALPPKPSAAAAAAGSGGGGGGAKTAAAASAGECSGPPQKGPVPTRASPPAAYKRMAVCFAPASMESAILRMQQQLAASSAARPSGGLHFLSQPASLPGCQPTQQSPQSSQPQQPQQPQLHHQPQQQQQHHQQQAPPSSSTSQAFLLQPPSSVIEELNRALAKAAQRIEGYTVAVPRSTSSLRLEKECPTPRTTATGLADAKEAPPPAPASVAFPAEENKENRENDGGPWLHWEHGDEIEAYTGLARKVARRDSLAAKLRNRPSKEELERKNILPRQSSVERQEQRQQIGTKLSRRLTQRPSAEELEQRNILKQRNTDEERDEKREIKQRLSRKLSQRPTVEELREKRILIRFNDYVEVSDAQDYDRRADKPWTRLTAADKAAIRKELNEYKSREMEVHEHSKHLTRFHRP
ncbi:phosphatase and actin regulator 1-like isoform X1 [Petromyzon marinus]|uniref:phosphatase and actin regulator 1-like isoform X1 n=1 Tax=Petromyzon marinus TaxID=7757 RepID=UPI003F70A7F0